MLLVVKLLEKADTKLDVEIKESRLSCAFHEDDLHQLLQQRGVVIKVIHELMLDFVEVFLRDLVQENTKLADLGGELVVRFFLSSE